MKLSELQKPFCLGTSTIDVGIATDLRQDWTCRRKKEKEKKITSDNYFSMLKTGHQTLKLP